MRGEDDAGVLLPERLQPFAELAGEALVVEREPAFIDDQQGWATVEAVLYRGDSLCVSSQVGCAVGCPFCMTMLEDGVKSKEAEEKVQVKDVAELVAMAMKKKPKPAAEEAPAAEDASA